MTDKYVRGFTALTGGVDGCLDNWTSASVGDGDRALGVADGVFRAYVYDASSTATHNPPAVVQPASGSGRWHEIPVPATRSLRHQRSIGLTAAASATNGIQVPDHTSINFGTRSFSIEKGIVLDDYTPASDVVLARKHDGTNGWILSILTTGKIRITINAANYDSTVAVSTLGVIDGGACELGVSVTRETAMAAGSVLFVVGGRQLGSAVAIPAAAPGTVTNTSALYLLGTSTTRTAGRVYYCMLYPWARALSAFQAFYRVGQSAADVIASSQLASGSVTRANTKISAADGTAFVDFSTADVLTDYVPYKGKLTIADSTGKKLVGYIKAQGSGETYGSELVTNGDMETGDPPTGWTAHGNAVLDGVADERTDGGGVQSLAVESGTTGWYAHQTKTVVVGGLYKNIYWGKTITGAGFKMAFFNSGGTVLNPSVTTSASWVNVVQYITPTGSTSLLIVASCTGASTSNGGTQQFDDISVKQVLTPSVTGVTITSTADGTTYNWESKESGFNYNDVAGYTYAIEGLPSLILGGGGIQPPPGQWHDASIHKRHALQPAAGSYVIPRPSRFEIRSVNTWTASSAAQYLCGVNQNILTARHFITDIVSRALLTTDVKNIEIGDGSDADRYVAAVTPMATPIVHTLANRLPDGTNLKMLVTPAASATMTIQFILRGYILDEN